MCFLLCDSAQLGGTPACKWLVCSGLECTQVACLLWVGKHKVATGLSALCWDACKWLVCSGLGSMRLRIESKNDSRSFDKKCLFTQKACWLHLAASSWIRLGKYSRSNLTQQKPLYFYGYIYKCIYIYIEREIERWARWLFYHNLRKRLKAGKGKPQERIPEHVLSYMKGHGPLCLWLNWSSSICLFFCFAFIVAVPRPRKSKKPCTKWSLCALNLHAHAMLAIYEEEELMATFHKQLSVHMCP